MEELLAERNELVATAMRLQAEVMEAKARTMDLSVDSCKNRAESVQQTRDSPSGLNQRHSPGTGGGAGRGQFRLELFGVPNHQIRSGARRGRR